jgi:hypothetical protein
MQKGTALWNIAVFNQETKHWQGSTSIFLSPALQHLVLDFGILLLGRAQWVVCDLDQEKN